MEVTHSAITHRKHDFSFSLVAGGRRVQICGRLEPRLESWNAAQVFSFLPQKYVF